MTAGRERIAMAGLIVGAVAALAVLGWTTPGYMTLTGPITVPGRVGETVAGRGFEVRVGEPRFARRIRTRQFGRVFERDTGGVWALAPVEAMATEETTTLAGAFWLGASGRRYVLTQRLGPSVQLTTSSLEPGLKRSSVLVFEIPPDEAAGGALLLSRNPEPRLDSQLRIAMPATLDPSRAEDVVELPRDGG